MFSNPDSWVIFAIPRLQLEVLEEAWEPPAPTESKKIGDYFMQRFNDLVCHNHCNGSSQDVGCSKRLRSAKKKFVAERRRRLALRYSRDGTPSFAYSSKPALLKYNNIRADDFLWAGGLPGSLRSVETEEDVEGWWDNVRYLVRSNRRDWRKIRDAMASNACLIQVISKPNMNWVEVGPASSNMVKGSGFDDSNDRNSRKLFQSAPVDSHTRKRNK